VKALLLAENWPPQHGGIEDYLWHIAYHLPNNSVQVVASVARGSAHDVKKGGGIDAVSLKRFFWPVIRPAWLPLFVSVFRRVKRERVDFVLCGKALCEGLIGYYLHRFLGVPYIVFTYAMEIETWAGAARHRRQLKRVLGSAARVVYINDATRARLQKLGVKDTQLVKIWPGVDGRFFDLAPGAAVERIIKKYALTQPYILCVGRLIPRKGMDILVEAFAKLEQTKFSHVHLVIAGAGPESERLQEMARQNFIESSVHFLGDIPDEDMPALYGGSILFALTPRQVGPDIEGFGIVYLEAAAQGVPAIATKSGGAAEAVEHEKTGLVVQPDSPRAVQQALERLLNDSVLRAQLGRQARERAWAQFRWPKRILLVKGMIDAILAERFLPTLRL
jgi:phosphatidylinositol alpha-1,6-mannosyltransferase